MDRSPASSAAFGERPMPREERIFSWMAGVSEGNNEGITSKTEEPHLGSMPATPFLSNLSSPSSTASTLPTPWGSSEVPHGLPTPFFTPQSSFTDSNWQRINSELDPANYLPLDEDVAWPSINGELDPANYLPLDQDVPWPSIEQPEDAKVLPDPPSKDHERLASSTDKSDGEERMSTPPTDVPQERQEWLVNLAQRALAQIEENRIVQLFGTLEERKRLGLDAREPDGGLQITRI